MGTPSPIEQHHLIVLFDGVCNLCSSSVLFVIKRDHASRFRFAPLQSAYAKSILSTYFPNEKENALFSVLLIANNKIYTRSAAALRIARHLDGLWPVFYILLLIPRFIRDPVYNLISRNRYKLFGKKDACMIPTPELKARFLE